MNLHQLDLQSNNCEHFYKIDRFFTYKDFCISSTFTSARMLSFSHSPVQLNTSIFEQKISSYLISKVPQLNNTKNVCQKNLCKNKNNCKQNICAIKHYCREYSSIRLLRVKIGLCIKYTI